MAMPEGKTQPATPEIRTMRDDLSSAKTRPQQPAATSPLPPKPPTPPPAPAAKPSPNVKEKPVPEPKPKKKGSRALVITTVVFIIALLAAGGVWAWIFFGDQLQIQEEVITNEVVEPQPLAYVLPDSALMVAYYNVSNQTDRAAVIQNWDSVSEDAASMRGLLAGDPRLILENTNANEFAYVLLSGDPRLYLIAPGSTELDNLIAERSNVQSESIAQWQVLHAFSTEMYMSKLQQGTRLLQDAPQSFGAPLTLYMKDEIAQQINQSEVLSAENNQDIIFSVTITPNGQTAQIVREDVARPDTQPVVAGQTDILGQLSTDIPQNVQFAVFGQDFSQSGVSAQSPAAQNIINQLSGPYAYFKQTDAAGIDAIGLVITIPDSAENTFAVGDSQLEELLTTTIAPVIGITEPLGTPAYADNTHAEIPLRYINITPDGKAIDYTIHNNRLYIATSKLSMFDILETAVGQAPGIADNEDIARLLTISEENYHQAAVSNLKLPALRSLVPHNLSNESEQPGLPYRVNIYTTPAGNYIDGEIILQPN